MLVHTHMPASDIALAIGFDEPTHFGKLFRRKEGCTPGEFRDRYRPG
jgi:AraC-like DNA-binding protein